MINRRAFFIRRVSVDSGRTVTIVDVDGRIFYVGIDKPTSSPATEGDPRSATPYTISWRSGLLGPGDGPIGAGSRIATLDTVYELTTDPRDVMSGTRTIGKSAFALPVAQLYPYDGVLTEQDGTEVRPIGWAVWSPSESHRDTGSYTDMTAAAPLDFRDDLHRNRHIVMAGTVYRIIDANVEVSEGRVTFSVRRAD